MNLIGKLRGAKAVEHPHSILTFIRETTDEYVEASPDFGRSWKKLPLSEILDVEVIRDQLTAKGSYPLVRLILHEEHPQIEITALRAQIQFLRDGGACSCKGCEGERSSPGVLEPSPMMPIQCGTVCAGENGCDWWACIYWCGILR